LKINIFIFQRERSSSKNGCVRLKIIIIIIRATKKIGPPLLGASVYETSLKLHVEKKGRQRSAPNPSLVGIKSDRSRIVPTLLIGPPHYHQPIWGMTLPFSLWSGCLYCSWAV